MRQRRRHFLFRPRRHRRADLCPTLPPGICVSFPTHLIYTKLEFFKHLCCTRMRQVFYRFTILCTFEILEMQRAFIVKCILEIKLNHFLNSILCHVVFFVTPLTQLRQIFTSASLINDEMHKILIKQHVQKDEMELVGSR